MYADRSSPTKSTLKDATITVINAAGEDSTDEDTTDPLADSAESWYIRVELGADAANTDSIELHYKNARAPRIRTVGDDKLKIEAFSDPDVSNDADAIDGCWYTSTLCCRT